MLGFGHTQCNASELSRHGRAGRGSDTAFEPLGFYVWQGASGRSFTHAVYSLLACPAPLAACYVLVRREADGQRCVLGTGHTLSTSASLNLAQIRRSGAMLGANEVHLHALGESAQERAVTAFDIAAALSVLGAPSQDDGCC